MKPRIVALVPMRHHSERVPGKNYRFFSGRMLYHHIVESLLNCPLIDEVVIDTDSEIITEDARENFPKVRVLERPQHLRAGTTSMNDVLLNDVAQIEADFYLQTHSTNPLLAAETIGRDAKCNPINHDPCVLLRTQDLPAVYEENSCLYIFDRKTLEAGNNRIGERPLMFEIGGEEVCDIDEELDFRIAEFLYIERAELRR